MSKSKTKKNRNREDGSPTPHNAKGKRARKNGQQPTHEFNEFAAFDRSLPKAPTKPKDIKPLVARNPKQKDWMQSLIDHDISFGTGPAGTGKTYVSAGLACDLLIANKIDRIIITRPIQTVDEELGFTTGDLDAKFAIHLEPYWDVFHERLGESLTEYFIKQRRILPAPLGFMRGRTFKRSWVILDEAQNTTSKQMKMFLTRIGEGSKFIINGDLTQVDLPRNVTSGLHDAMKRFKTNPRFGFVEFESKDVVRHGLIQEIVEAYEK